ncbi:hypothetical protein COV13_03175 [Candidatus Woesearchaeota archaeon CG10_big_fil_rev_8_21_14_0_10_32_9]|nr:MAG: hypothetical protein COV13_03175 [Candidatus Woesearchaeota archaeon CG10_big_fil_rev_8_21_14_0_10_32_9]
MDGSTEKRKKSKKSVKKATSVNKTNNIKVKQKIENAPSEQYFILSNGQPVKNVKELADVLEHVSEDIFNHHVTNEKNDFANWTKDVFKEIELAQELAGTNNKDHTRIVLYKHIIKKLGK